MFFLLVNKIATLTMLIIFFSLYDDSSAAESYEAGEQEDVTLVKTTNSIGSSVSTSSSNAYVMIDALQETDDDETESSRQFVKVELSVSETRPVRSSGSGEEDTEEEPRTFSTVSTPASSINTYSQAAQRGINQQQAQEDDSVVNNIEEQGILCEWCFLSFFYHYYFYD